ncbi:OmpA family protein [Hymenobacter gummosus]|uniref:OmpA family protein n=1 Tax=Hymenobacter gummosus TaxID=1776032 RepID=A0A3S0K5I4_9BACT|nr:OmpA family protein [Hymenobacter gummosus]RTQ49754.1 OmpA family protein [Hymenobacter gummosus]
MKNTLAALGLTLLSLTACRPDKTPQGEIVSRQTPEGPVLGLSADWLFEDGRPELKPTAEPALQQLAQRVRAQPRTLLLVRCYTDSRGDDNENAQLAQVRAEAVAGWLRQHQVTVPMEVQGLGEADPLVPNARPDGSDDPEARARNRRVEIVLR